MSESQVCKVRPQKHKYKNMYSHVIYIYLKNMQKHSYIAGGSINWYCLDSVKVFIKINPVNSTSRNLLMEFIGLTQ